MNTAGHTVADDRRQSRRNAWLAWIGAAVALTGVQLIAPALPVMQDEFGLSDSQLALVMSVYLLPAAIASIPVGMLADRLGRRLVYGVALVLFGACGIVLVLVDDFTTFLVVRFLQGLGFAGLLPLSMTILGDAFSGIDLVGAQGARSVAMSIGDGVLPVVGGLLVGLSWFAPWLGQTLAIPLGIVVLVTMVDSPSVQRARERGRVGSRELLRLFKSLPIFALQYAGFLRMFLKFCILTFFPVFLVDVRSLTPAFAGVAVGVAALAGTGIAAMSGRLARIGKPTTWVITGVVGMGVALIGLVTLPWPWAILAAAVSYGACDGMLGVFINSFVTAATGAEQRASFVSATGAIRNFAKFAAPVVFAALIVPLPIGAAFVLVGAMTIVSTLVVMMLSPLEEGLVGQPPVRPA